VARLLAQKMTQSMGQPVLVENKPGASTLIGTEMLAKATPDGYTLGLITDSHAINPSFFAKLPYDSVKDFSPVSQLVFVPLVMVAHPSLNVKTLPELIAAAKAKPRQNQLRLYWQWHAAQPVDGDGSSRSQELTWPMCLTKGLRLR
jgi:tripartite-type tricarboxylate transporter receptor subunit TctC